MNTRSGQISTNDLLVDDSFVLFEADNIAGTFDAITGRDLGDGKILEISRDDGDSMMLTATVREASDGDATSLDGPIIATGDGNDTVSIDSVDAQVFAGSGDDTLTIASPTALDSLKVADGGAGTDQLCFATDFNNSTVDLTSVSGERFENIEELIFGSGVSGLTLKLDEDFLKALESSQTQGSGDDANPLVLIGSNNAEVANNTVELSGWSEVSSGTGYSIYESSNHEVSVRVDTAHIQVTLTGSAD